MSEWSLSEIKTLVYMTCIVSAPVLDGISYRLFKRSFVEFTVEAAQPDYIKWCPNYGE